MEPHLQLQCGPMLRYDTCKDGIYHAFAMIVTADTGSDYSATPFMAYRYTPRSGGASGLEQQFSQSVSLQDGQQGGSSSGGEVVETVEARKIFIYHSLSGGNSFWRFKIEVKQGELEMPVHYRVNNGREITFYVPGREQNFRFVGHSCNGFSAGVDTEAFNASRRKSTLFACCELIFVVWDAGPGPALERPTQEAFPAAHPRSRGRWRPGETHPG